MKKLIILACLLIACNQASANEITINVDDVTLRELINLSTEIDNKISYIIGYGVDEKVTVKVKKEIEKEEVHKVVELAVKSLGLKIINYDEYRVITNKDIYEKEKEDQKSEDDEIKDIQIIKIVNKYLDESQIQGLSKMFNTEIIKIKGSDDYLVRGSFDDVEVLRNKLISIDKEEKNIEIQGIIAEVGINDNQENGITWKGAVDSIGLMIGGITNSYIGFNDIGALIKVIKGINNIKIISEPYMLIKENEIVEYASGKTVPYKIGTGQTEIGNQVETYEYRKTGLIIKIKPEVIGENINIDIEISNSEISELSERPSTVDNSIKTKIRSKDKDFIILGGLTKSKDQKKVMGIPLLMDLPYIGLVFRWEYKETDKSELMIILKVNIKHD